MVKKLFLILFFISASTTVHSQDNLPREKSSPGYLSESAKYVFFNHYWLNMHHFLQHEARIKDKTDSSSVESGIWKKLSSSDKNIFGEVVGFYQKKLTNKNLRSSDYMSAFKTWVIGQKEKGLSSVPAEFKEHTEHLENFTPIYNQYLWKTHSARNKKVISEKINLIKATEDSVFEKIADLAHSYWPRNKIRVDITYFANSRNNAFTTIFPTHIVMPSTNYTTTQGSWVELIYHEAGHQIIRGGTGFIAGTIQDVSTVENKGLRSLSHAYLFYIAGTAAKENFQKEGIEDYEIYMIRNNVYGLYIPALKKYMPEYINRTATLADVTRRIIQDVHKELDKRESDS